MTREQYNETMRIFVQEWHWAGGTRCEDYIEEMYRTRCKLAGINYAEFCEERKYYHRRKPA